MSGLLTTQRRISAVTVIAAALLAAATTPAAANPPKLLAGGASGGIATAQWTLETNALAEFFEIAHYPDVNAYGYFVCNGALRGREFCGSNPAVERFGVLESDQTSLIPADATPPLAAGTYYFHIAGHDRACSSCAQIEFSETLQITLDANGNTTSAVVVAPGTGQSNSKAIPGDRILPTTQLRYSRRQHIDKLAVRARMSEPGTLTARALVDVGGSLAKIYSFKPATRKVAGGLLVTLRPKISKRQKRALKRAMRRGKRLRARVTVTAVDRAGNSTTRHAVIRLKP